MNAQEFRVLKAKYILPSEVATEEEFMYALAYSIIEKSMSSQISKRQFEIYSCLYLKPIGLGVFTPCMERKLYSLFDMVKLIVDFDIDYETFYAAILWYSVNVRNKTPIAV